MNKITSAIFGFSVGFGRSKSLKPFLGRVFSVRVSFKTTDKYYKTV